ncbi:hypothetical protein J5N97_005085 [Dioscorea zingiberensis]|uniref:Uncharacterized protein n=1 Tax=Dioscorea zingiberensis TaxID=325984 RepID=A0A9D5D8G3_9LILI|nr:hypothetical protein J5N97_005085 [Dioscorea zingiberensis]
MEGRSATEFMQARTHIWNHMLRYLDSSSLKCAVELGVPDAIHSHGGPMTISELVQALSIPASRAPFLRRIMRLLVDSGFFSILKRNEDDDDDDDDEVYDLTSSSKLLINNGSSESLAPLVLFISGLEIGMAGQSMGAWIKGGEVAKTPFHLAHGKGAVELTAERPEFNAAFNDAMASDSRVLMRAVVKDWGQVLFGGLRSLVDAGGGSGGAAVAIAEEFPEVKCSVLDLPHVIAMQPESALVEFVKGDYFEHVPPADAVLLKWILHGWNHENCVKILRKCKDAIPEKEKGGKVIIIDTMVGHGAENRDTISTQYLLDIHMMTVAAGIERDENEWKAMFVQAGFQSYKIICDFGVHCVIEVYP